MNLFILLTALWVINVSNINVSVPIPMIKLNEGIDERFSIEYDEDKEIIYRIQKHQHKFDILKKIESSISINEKIDEIKNMDISASYKRIQLTEGGLMNDWDFEDFSTELYFK